MKITLFIRSVSLILKKFLCSLSNDQIFYQVREGKRTKWITREEWFHEQKINPFASQMICGTEKKEIRYGK